jgi:type IV pilus assembly protein PilW
MLELKTNRIQTGLRQDGMTLVELMVALAVGSFLIVGAVQVYSQSRQAYVVNDSIARVQETAQFAMDTIEADLRLASNYGMNSRGDTIVGRATAADGNPLSLNVPTNEVCAVDWALALERPIEGSDDYGLACAPASSVAQANSDTITIRRATVDPVAFDPTRLQIQSTRLQGQLFDDGAMPTGFTATESQTHNLIVNSYYVDADSDLIPGVPTLRRKSLGVSGGAPAVVDLEVAPGIENLQVQFGVDTDDDNTVDRYVDPGHTVLTSPVTRILTARVWLVVRSISPEIGIVDNTDYEPGNEDLGVPSDQFRRLQVSKTILLRNART